MLFRNNSETVPYCASTLNTSQLCFGLRHACKIKGTRPRGASFLCEMGNGLKAEAWVRLRGRHAVPSARDATECRLPAEKEPVLEG